MVLTLPKKIRLAMNTPIQSNKHWFAIRLAAVAAMLAIPTGLKAVINIDGKVGGIAEGYTDEYNMTFDIAAGGKFGGSANNLPGGKLFTAVNGNVLSVGFIAPLAIDDNLYGTASTGWPGGYTHTYNDLDGSDEWVLTIKNPANTSKTFVLTLGYLPGSDASTYDGKTLATGAVINKTSMDFNLANYPAATTNSNTSGSNGPWISEIMYEWQIDFTGLSASFGVADLLASFAVSERAGNYFHMSPNKIGDNKVQGDIPTLVNPPVGTPDAGGTAMLLGLALLGMGALNRKLRKA